MVYVPEGQGGSAGNTIQFEFFQISQRIEVEEENVCVLILMVEIVDLERNASLNIAAHFVTNLGMGHSIVEELIETVLHLRHLQ